MPENLSPEKGRIVDLLFPEEDREAAYRMLLEMEEGDKIGFVGTERAQYAALKVSHGNLDRLRKAIDVGKTDGRDLVTAAGFGGPDTYKSWVPKPGEGSWWERFRERRWGIR